MSHTIITFITEIIPDRLPELRQTLSEIAADLSSNPYIPFPRLETLHFASLVIVEDDKMIEGPDRFGPCLIFESNFDGPLDPYIEALFNHAAAGLHRTYSCCKGYTAAGPEDRAAILAYLRSHVVWPNASYVGNVGRSLARIRQEADLRKKIDTFLDDSLRPASTSARVSVSSSRSSSSTRASRLARVFSLAPASSSEVTSHNEVRNSIQRFMSNGGSQTVPVKTSAAAVGARQNESMNADAAGNGSASISDYQLRQSQFATAVSKIRFALAFAATGLLYLLGVLLLRRLELKDPVTVFPPNLAHHKKLAEQEDRIVQNHFANVNRVKPGIIRKNTLRVVLWFINQFTATQTKGTLGGIPTIHFAHWSLIDNGRRLLFLSNYDGSWDSYLDDFIEKASKTLTAIWSNTVDFPPSRFLILDGASDAKRFKELVRNKQIPANVWYSAYPDLTVRIIDNNSAIREGLFASLDEAATKRWLRRF